MLQTKRERDVLLKQLNWVNISVPADSRNPIFGNQFVKVRTSSVFQKIETLSKIMKLKVDC